MLLEEPLLSAFPGRRTLDTSLKVLFHSSPCVHKETPTLLCRSLDQDCAGQCFPATASPFFLLLSLFLGTCAMLVKETGVTVFGVCLVYDLFSPSHQQDKS